MIGLLHTFEIFVDEDCPPNCAFEIGMCWLAFYLALEATKPRYTADH
jgi:hypothetical protein